MSALARYFLSQGKVVAGYDRVSTSLTDKLTMEGIDIHFEDQAVLIPEAFRNPDRTGPEETDQARSSNTAIIRAIPGGSQALF